MDGTSTTRRWSSLDPAVGTLGKFRTASISACWFRVEHRFVVGLPLGRVIPGRAPLVPVDFLGGSFAGFKFPWLTRNGELFAVVGTVVGVVVILS